MKLRDTFEPGRPEIGPGFVSRIQKRPGSGSNATRPFRWFSSFRRSELTSFEQQAETIGQETKNPGVPKNGATQTVAGFVP